MIRLAAGILLFTVLPALCWAESPLRVFVSVLPLTTFVERIGGSHVRVEAMVQPGHSPATYEPTPRQIAALAEADLYIRIGVSFENAWMGRIQAVNPDMPVLDARDGIALRETQAHRHHGEMETKDPHVWTSPSLVKIMVGSFRNRLSELDPAHREYYAAHSKDFIEALDRLDREICEILAHASTRRFMVFHPAWGYFADAYDLTQVAIEREGKEPGPRALAALINQAKREKVKVIFVQPQYSRRSAQQVARAIDGRVEAMDPLARNYFASLRRVARLIAQAGEQ